MNTRRMNSWSVALAAGLLIPADSHPLAISSLIFWVWGATAGLDLMRGELDRRGVGADEILDHYQRRRATVIMLDDGTAMRCSFCDRPAVLRRYDWHRLWGRIPLFPRVFAYCDRHQSAKAA